MELQPNDCLPLPARKCITCDQIERHEYAIYLAYPDPLVEYNRVLDFKRAREINLNIFKTAMRMRDNVLPRPKECKSSLYQQHIQ
jgi:hypothetical protein